MGINNIFGSWYENFVYHGVYSLELFNNNFYTYFGLIMIIIPLVVMAVFYFINKNPYGKLWHWLIAWIIAGAIVTIVSYNMLREELAVYVLDPENYPDVSGFVMNLSLTSLAYSMVVGFAISLLYKQVPGPQSTLPFRIKKK
jgi:hypothetical protein